MSGIPLWVTDSLVMIRICSRMNSWLIVIRVMLRVLILKIMGIGLINILIMNWICRGMTKLLVVNGVINLLIMRKFSLMMSTWLVSGISLRMDDLLITTLLAVRSLRISILLIMNRIDLRMANILLISHRPWLSMVIIIGILLLNWILEGTNL